MDCTCHPDDRPPVCQHRYASGECAAAWARADKARVVSLNAQRANRENDNTLLTPVECLFDAIEDEKTQPSTSLLVLRLDASEGRYDVRFNACNLKSSEKVTLLEAMKMVVFRNMRFIPDA